MVAVSHSCYAPAGVWYSRRRTATNIKGIAKSEARYHQPARVWFLSATARTRLVQSLGGCGHGGQTDTLSHSAIFSTGEPAELAPLDNLVGERLV